MKKFADKFNFQRYATAASPSALPPSDVASLTSRLAHVLANFPLPSFSLRPRLRRPMHNSSVIRPAARQTARSIPALRSLHGRWSKVYYVHRLASPVNGYLLAMLETRADSYRAAVISGLAGVKIGATVFRVKTKSMAVFSHVRKLWAVLIYGVAGS